MNAGALTRAATPSKLADMQVNFTPEQMARLSEIARYHGTDTEQLVRNAALLLIEEDRLFLEAVERGIEQADRGDLIDHEEVVARFERKYGA